MLNDKQKEHLEEIKIFNNKQKEQLEGIKSQQLEEIKNLKKKLGLRTGDADSQTSPSLSPLPEPGPDLPDLPDRSTEPEPEPTSEQSTQP